MKRPDLEVRLVPEDLIHQDREIILAYTNPFGGAGIELTVTDALELSNDLRAQVTEVLTKEVERKALGCQHSKTERGAVYEICSDCGAVRNHRRLGDQWHVCHLCRL